MFNPTRKQISWFICLIVAILSLSGCSGADESWALVQLLTKGEQMVTNTQTAEVRNCGGLPEKKTVQCSAGTESNMSISLGGSVLVGLRGTLDASVATELGFNRTSGQTLELETPLTGYIARYRIITDYRVISGRGLARSSSGRKQEISYTFQADCALKIDSKEVVSCGGQGQLSIPTTAAPRVTVPPSRIPPPTATPLLTYAPPPTYTPQPPPTNSPQPSRNSAPPIGLPFQDNFDKGIRAEWRVLSGQPIVTNGYLGAATNEPLILEIGNESLGNYAVNFAYRDAHNNVWLGGIVVTIAEQIRFETHDYPRWQAFQNNKWIDITQVSGQIALPGNLRFTINGSTYRVYTNGNLFSEIIYGTPLSGPFRIAIQKDTFIDNFVMTSP